jgi:hypothetical protein
VIEEDGINKQHSKVLWLRNGKITVELTRLQNHRRAIATGALFSAIAKVGRSYLGGRESIALVEVAPRRLVFLGNQEFDARQFSGLEPFDPRLTSLLCHEFPVLPVGKPESNDGHESSGINPKAKKTPCKSKNVLSGAPIFHFLERRTSRGKRVREGKLLTIPRSSCE